MNAVLSFPELLELEQLVFVRERGEAERDFASFVRQAWHVLEPSTELIWNWHMDVVCGYLQALYEGRLRVPRLIVNIPPGTSKSLVTAVFWPAWIWAQEPAKRFLTASNDQPLVSRDNLKMRALVTSEWYVERWGAGVQKDPSQWDKGLFQNTALGFRQGVTVKGSVTGKRGDVQIIDDPHDARKAFSDVEIHSTCELGWDQGMSTRVNSMQHSLRVLIMQRLRTNDLTGHLLAKAKQEWVHVCIPMEYPGEHGYDPVRDIGPEAAHLADPRRKRGELLDPVRFPQAEVEALKEDLGEYGAAGQLQQRPAPLSGGILKNHWWRIWGEESWNRGKALPRVLHVFASWDTAFTEADLAANAYSAMTLWGVFWHEACERYALLLLGTWWERCDYPTLRTKSKEIRRKKLTNMGDAHLIERKASGIPLIQDLRRDTRETVRGFDPGPYGDKVARAYLAQPVLKAGLVYVPDTSQARGSDGELDDWAGVFRGIVSEFPAGGPPCADLTDTTTQAILYLQKGWWLTHPDDDAPPPKPLELSEEEEEDAMVSATAKTGDRVYG